MDHETCDAFFNYMVFDDSTLGSPCLGTEVGEFENSGSPYGTFDQAGNVREWTEEIYRGFYSALRGGSYDQNYFHLTPGFDFISGRSSFEQANTGFRLVHVPEPASPALLSIGGALLARRRAA